VKAAIRSDPTKMPEPKAFVRTFDINLTQKLGESKIGVFWVQIEGLNYFNTIFIA
jgi:hypothetical protein